MKDKAYFESIETIRMGIMQQASADYLPMSFEKAHRQAVVIIESRPEPKRRYR